MKKSPGTNILLPQFICTLILLAMFSPLAERAGLINRAHAAVVESTACGASVLPDDPDNVVIPEQVNCNPILSPGGTTLTTTDLLDSDLVVFPMNDVPEAQSSPIPATVNLPDNRVRVQPARNDVGLIAARYSDGSFSLCTGFVVADNASNNTLALPAHCLEQISSDKNPHPGLVASRVEYYVGADDTSYSQRCDSTSVSVNPAYEKLGEHIEDDYGKVILGCRLPANMALRLTTSIPKVGEDVISVGYPADKQQFTQWTSTGSLLSKTNKSVDTSNYSYSGQSGSPLLDNNGQAFAITSSVSPDATSSIRITCGVEQFYLGADAPCQ